MEKEQATAITASSPAEDTSALVAIDTASLSEEAKDLLNKLIAENDLDKAKDLTYLFNVNQTKKTLVRIDTLSETQDLLVKQLFNRVKDRPDNISNAELMQAIRLIQEIIERGGKQASVEEKPPFIQINQQNNNLSGDKPEEMDRESRDRVKRAVLQFMSKIKGSENVSKDVIDALDGVEDKTDDQ